MVTSRVWKSRLIAVVWNLFRSFTGIKFNAGSLFLLLRYVFNVTGSPVLVLFTCLAIRESMDPAVGPHIHLVFGEVERICRIYLYIVYYPKKWKQIKSPAHASSSPLFSAPIVFCRLPSISAYYSPAPIYFVNRSSDMVPPFPLLRFSVVWCLGLMFLELLLLLLCDRGRRPIWRSVWLISVFLLNRRP